MPTPLMHPLKYHVGNLTSPIETLEDHLLTGEEEGVRRTPQDHHPQEAGVEVGAEEEEAEEVAAAEEGVAGERSRCPDTPHPN